MPASSWLDGMRRTRSSVFVYSYQLKDKYLTLLTRKVKNNQIINHSESDDNKPEAKGEFMRRVIVGLCADMAVPASWVC